MHDYKSYEPVEFSKMDSAYSRFEDEPEYIITNTKLEQVKDSILKVKEVGEDLMRDIRIRDISYYYRGSASWSRDRAELKKLTDDMSRLTGRMHVLTDTLTNFLNSYKSRFIGFMVTHSFRGKNMNGATILTSRLFILNKTLDSVIYEFEADNKK